MAGLAFISYRRDDTSQVAQALYLQLKETFGAGQLFMDAHSIRVGEAWPDRIRQRLGKADVVLALMGPSWLFAADQYGRRRIDNPADWVRNEIIEAMRRPIDVIPVVIGDMKNFPDREGLPKKLAALSPIQAKVLRLAPGEWAGDMCTLRNVLMEYGLVPEPSPPQPVPSPRKSRTPLLDADQVAAALKRLPEWEAWIDALPLEYPKMRQELRRTFTLKNFREAMKFMNFLVALFEKEQHHPRWENAWNQVRIRLTTWDAGNMITKYDVRVAHKIEAAYRRFKRGRGR